MQYSEIDKQKMLCNKQNILHKQNKNVLLIKHCRESGSV